MSLAFQEAVDQAPLKAGAMCVCMTPLVREQSSEGTERRQPPATQTSRTKLAGTGLWGQRSGVAHTPASQRPPSTARRLSGDSRSDTCAEGDHATLAGAWEDPVALGWPPKATFFIPRLSYLGQFTHLGSPRGMRLKPSPLRPLCPTPAPFPGASPSHCPHRNPCLGLCL